MSSDRPNAAGANEPERELPKYVTNWRTPRERRLVSIVADLAMCRPPMRDAGAGRSVCCLCGAAPRRNEDVFMLTVPSRHPADCPWRRARQEMFGS